MKILELKINYKILVLLLGIVLVLSLGGNAWLLQKNQLMGSIGSFLIKPVSAEEIYPLFYCPCCGQPLDPNKICCGAMKERIDYIDDLVKMGGSEDEIILSYIKEYGLNSFVDKEMQKEFREKLAAQAPDDRPIISLGPDSYDFGDVSQKEGKVYTYFDLKNEGKNDLIIDKLETSCGCTFASIIFKGEESPYFTMPGHGYENPEWQGVTIAPGEIAQLKVMYNPDVHEDFRGAAIREIHVFSNDPIDFEKKVRVELNQVD